jgi:hypothetical protein
MPGYGIENPRVGGSIPSLATIPSGSSERCASRAAGIPGLRACRRAGDRGLAAARLESPAIRPAGLHARRRSRARRYAARKPRSPPCRRFDSVLGHQKIRGLCRLLRKSLTASADRLWNEPDRVFVRVHFCALVERVARSMRLLLSAGQGLPYRPFRGADAVRRRGSVSSIAPSRIATGFAAGGGLFALARTPPSRRARLSTFWGY